MNKKFHNSVCEAVKALQDAGHHNIVEPNVVDPTAMINPKSSGDLYLGKTETHQEYKKLMIQARKVNQKRDADERAMGLLAASDGSPDSILRTAILAIRAGIISKDVTCLAEAQAMIELVEYRLRRCVVSIKN